MLDIETILADSQPPVAEYTIGLRVSGSIMKQPAELLRSQRQYKVRTQQPEQVRASRPEQLEAQRLDQARALSFPSSKEAEVQLKLTEHKYMQKSSTQQTAEQSLQSEKGVENFFVPFLTKIVSMIAGPRAQRYETANKQDAIIVHAIGTSIVLRSSL